MDYSILWRRLGASCVYAVCLLLTACTEELLPADAGANVPEGLPAAVTLSWDTSEMGVQTRAALSDDESSRVNTLWIGIYGEDGHLKTSYFEPRNGEEGQHKVRSITLETTSGKCHIVGVANVTTNYGISDNEELNQAVGKPAGTSAGLSPLRDLLDKADTWEKFKSISAALLDSTDVSRFTPNLVMSGVYYEQADSDPVDWIDANEQTVSIAPGSSKLPGAIHLRRLISYVKFNLIAGKGITVEPTSWRVYNNPIICSLHEQTDNSADRSLYLLAKTGDRNNYGTSSVSYTFEKATEKEDGVDGYTFDFYQMENKQTGLADVIKTYNDRELEYKNADGTNTGIYRSLCPTNRTPDTENGVNTANFASFVEIRARVTYQTNITVDGTTQQVDRTGYAVYTIHLGGCDKKWTDFTNLRNTKYTYNVTVNGLNDIVVEAKRDGLTPGAEGNVTDTYAKVYELDAHYGVFNIQLSNEERTALTYRILAPFGNEMRELARDESPTGHTVKWKNRVPENQLYNWICFLPTSGEKVLAKYDPKDVWYLEDMKDLTGHRSYNGSTDPADRTLQWYTVFINEYVYQLDKDGELIEMAPADIATHSDETGQDWHKYVNKDNRIVWLTLDPINTSLDGENMYARSKFMISQKSMQTYYNSLSDNALGVEHENESYGLNMIWTLSTSGWNADNGRKNLKTYVTGKKWNSIIQETVSATSPAINRQGENKPETYPAIYQQVVATTRTASNYAPTSSRDFYEIQAACMTRNRDLNGDGEIDDNELRWYLPASGKYVRIILGRSSMKEPIMDYEANPTLPAGFSGGSDYLNRFRYSTSDGIRLWAEEGLSSNTLDRNTPDKTPWRVCCIRNIGVNLSAVVEHDPVQMAYVEHSESRTISMDFYDASSIRPSTSSFLPSHTVNSKRNKISAAFEYAAEDISPSDIDGEMKRWDDYANNESGHPLWKTACDENSVCGKYSQEMKDGKMVGGYNKGYADSLGWRVPNQKELVMMRRAGVFEKLGDQIKWLSCSQEFYNFIRGGEILQRFFGVTRTYSLLGSDGGQKVRCVRDVIDTTRQ